MGKEVISNKQGISIMVLFILGTNSIMASGFSAREDIWLANIIAIIIAIPMMLIYARLQSFHFNKDFFDIIEMCFGKIIGKFIIILMVTFTTFEIPVILRNFTQFPISVSLHNTPQIIVTIVFMFLCAWTVKSGIKTLGKFASFFLIPFIIVPLITVILVYNIINIDNIRPILSNDITLIFKGAYELLLFPFTQSIVFIIACSDFTSKKSPYKIYLLGVLIGGFILFVISVIVVMVLGVNETSSLFYPTYNVWLRINIGSIFQRIEIIQGVLFTVGAFIKISVYLMASSKGISKIFKFEDYKSIVTPIALLSIILAQYQFDSTTHYFEWSDDIWYYYVVIFQVILPVFIWIIIEIKRKYLQL